MNKQLDELLNRKMDRRDFLKHLGVGMLAVFGVSSAVKVLTTVNQYSSQKTSTKQTLNYGAGPYGGRRG